ncbi:MAG: hypothetical protein IJJ11_05245 [Methanosphaera sp.]|nr:hypothetical protein [Methanosphaera sp.]
MSDDSVLLTQSILIRGLTKKQYNVLVDISLKLNYLRNCAVEKTPFVKSTDKKHFKKINFKSIKLGTGRHNHTGCILRFN